MEATTEQRQQNAQLNQERAFEETGGETLESPEESKPNTGEYIIFLGIGAILDAAGLFSDASIFLIIPIRIITLPAMLIFLLWRFMKGGKKIYPGALVATALSETFLSFIPAYTGFVIFAWAKESKFVKQAIGKLEKFSKIKK